MKPVNRLVCLAVASVLSSTAYAQDLQLEEIVITATKREQTLQEAPISVAVTSAETIEQAQINDIADLQSIVPSLRVTTLQNSSQSNFIIRGFGNGGTNIGIEPSVGVFIDGVYRSRSVAAIGDLFDLERVEVLRGPQSTLFGLNASAGVISVVTAKPSYEWGGAVEATIGNYDYQGLRAKVTGPLSDTLAFSLAGNHFTRDGYFDLINLGTEINDRDRWDLRGQLLWEPSENLSFRLIADKGEIDELCCAVTNILAGPTAGLISLLGGQLDPNAPNSYNGYMDFTPRNQVDNSGVSLQVDWNLGNWSVTSITAQREVDSLFNTDIDFTSADLGTQVNDAKIDTFTQEFRLSYDAGGRFRGLVGAYFFEEDVDYDTSVSWGSDFRSYATLLVQASTGCFVGAPSCNPNAFGGLEAALGLPAGALLAGGQFNAQFTSQEASSSSFFGQLDFDVTDRLTATVGVSHTQTDKRVDMSDRGNELFGQLRLDQIGFQLIYQNLLLAGVPQPLALDWADRGSVTAVCPAGDPTCFANPLLGLYPFQFLAPVIPFENGKSDDSDTTYTVRLAFEATDNINVYAGVSTGFKASSWNLSRDSKPVLNPANPPLSPLGGYVNPFYPRYGSRLAGPEEATVYEIGMKARWETVALNIAVFDQEIKGFQSNLFVGTAFSLANAGKQSTEGLEVELLWAPIPALDINIAGTFLDPIYDSFPGAQGPDGPADLSGSTPAGIHGTSLSVGFTLKWQAMGLDGFLRADYLYEDEVQVTENVPKSVATREVGTLNASLGASRNGWSVLFWGRNLTDDEYLQSSFPSVAQAGSLSGYPNQPRTFGLTIRKTF